MSVGQVRGRPINGSEGTDRAVHVGAAFRRHGGSSMRPSERATRAAHTAVELCFESTRVHACVQERLATCPYAHFFNRVTWNYVCGTLTVEGSVPTFHMKQILQTMLRDLDDVEQIANQVDVVSSTGLSSERSAGSRW